MNKTQRRLYLLLLLLSYAATLVYLQPGLLTYEYISANILSPGPYYFYSLMSPELLQWPFAFDPFFILRHLLLKFLSLPLFSLLTLGLLYFLGQQQKGFMATLLILTAPFCFLNGAALGLMLSSLLLARRYLGNNERSRLLEYASAILLFSPAILSVFFRSHRSALRTAGRGFAIILLIVIFQHSLLGLLSSLTIHLNPLLHKYLIVSLTLVILALVSLSLQRFSTYPSLAVATVFLILLIFNWQSPGKPLNDRAMPNNNKVVFVSADDLRYMSLDAARLKRIHLVDLKAVPELYQRAEETNLFRGHRFADTLKRFLNFEESYATTLNAEALQKNNLFLLRSKTHPQREQAPFSRLNIWLKNHQHKETTRFIMF